MKTGLNIMTERFTCFCYQQLPCPILVARDFDVV